MGRIKADPLARIALKLLMLIAFLPVVGSHSTPHVCPSDTFLHFQHHTCPKRMSNLHARLLRITSGSAQMLRSREVSKDGAKQLLVGKVSGRREGESLLLQL